jgi:hypothetical protein
MAVAKEKVCDEYCYECKYYTGWAGENKFCNYYLITDIRRPCDPGTGCTVRVERKRNRTQKVEV